MTHVEIINVLHLQSRYFIKILKSKCSISLTYWLIYSYILTNIIIVTTTVYYLLNIDITYIKYLNNTSRVIMLKLKKHSNGT